MSTIIFQAVGTVVGAIIGTFFDDPYDGARLGFYAGSVVGGVYQATHTHPTTVYGPRLDDLRATTSTYGVRLPIAYGTIRVGSNLIWATNIIESQNTLSSGKGGHVQSAVEYSYAVSCAVAICQGPIAGITRIWMDKELAWQITPNTPVDQLDFNNTLAASVRIYKGDYTQGVDPTILASAGVADTSAYRGVAYLVFDTLQLKKYGNHIPNIEVEVCVKLSGAASTMRNVADANLNYGTYPYGAFGNVGPGRIYPDYRRKRVWASATTTGHKNRIAYLDMRTFTAGYIEVTSITPTYVQQVTYIPELDSLILTPQSNGLGTAPMYEVNPDNGTVKSSNTWTGPLVPMLLYPDPIRRQLMGVGADNGTGAIQLFRVATYPMTTIQWVANAANEGNISGGIAFNGGTVPDFNKFADLAFDPTWMYLALTNGNILALDPNRAPNVSGNVFVDGWHIGALSPGTYGAPKSMLGFQNNHDPILVCTIGSLSNFVVINPLAGGVEQYFALPNANSGASPTCLVADRNETIIFADNSPPYYLHDFTQVVSSYPFTAQGHTGACNYNGLLVTADATVQWNIFPYPPQATGIGSGLDEIVQDVAVRAGLTTGQIDVTDLGVYQVPGFVIATPMDARAAIQPLATAFQFDGVESDGKLKFIRRNKTSVINIPEDDYVVKLEDQTGLSDQIMIQRADENELPLTYAITYWDSATDYQRSTQYSRRFSGYAKALVNVEIPVVVSAAQAGALVDNLLYQAWTGRTRFKFSLPPKYRAYEPTDVVTLNKGALSFEARITSMSDDGLTFECNAMQQDSRNAA